MTNLQAPVLEASAYSEIGDLKRILCKPSALLTESDCSYLHQVARSTAVKSYCSYLHQVARSPQRPGALPGLSIRLFIVACIA